MSTTARYITAPQMEAFNNWDRLPVSLQGLDTRIYLIGPEGWLFNLAGRDAGKQGVRLAEQVRGDYHTPFELITTEGAYQMGITIERVNYTKRTMEAGLIVGGHAPVRMNAFQYRWAEDRFWSQLREDADSWFGIYTRFTGFRWTTCRLGQPVDTPQKQDVTAYNNNVARWDAQILSTRPYFSKPALFDRWDARQARLNPDLDGDGDPTTGSISLCNRGDMDAYVKFLITGAGHCTVQDNYSDRMVALPEITKDDGWVLCDTDPEERTLTTSKDPVDNLWYQIIRSSQILDAFLHNLAASGEPMWRRFDKRFLFSVPPHTEVTFNVKHDNPDATVTAILPQHYRRSR